MIEAARGRDENGPAIVLDQHGPVEGPRRGVRERPLRIGDAGDAAADRGVEPIATNDLPRRAIGEPDHHLVVVDVGPGPVREGLVDPSFSRMRINRSPDRLAALPVLRKAVPVVAGPPPSTDHGMMQADLVLAGPAMPDRHRALAAVL